MSDGILDDPRLPAVMAALSDARRTKAVDRTGKIERRAREFLVMLDAARVSHPLLKAYFDNVDGFIKHAAAYAAATGETGTPAHVAAQIRYLQGKLAT